MVNMYISPNGVVMGQAATRIAGRLAITPARRSADLLTGPVHIGAVFKIQGDVGQSVFRR